LLVKTKQHKPKKKINFISNSLLLGKKKGRA
jgi:hypothetical protein